MDHISPLQSKKNAFDMWRWGVVFSHSCWRYRGFTLLSHTNPMNRTTGHMISMKKRICLKDSDIITHKTCASKVTLQLTVGVLSNSSPCCDKILETLGFVFFLSSHHYGIVYNMFLHSSLNKTLKPLNICVFVTFISDIFLQSAWPCWSWSWTENDIEHNIGTH